MGEIYLIAETLKIFGRSVCREISL